MRRLKVAGLVAVLICRVTALEAAPDSENTKMRAIVIRAYGGPEVMKLEEVAQPKPAEDEVLIRVVAASINPVDVAIRKGYLAETGRWFSDHSWNGRGWYRRESREQGD